MKVKLLSFKYNKVIARFVNLLFVASSSIGCDQDEWPTYRLVPEFKDYVLFPEESYWVYNQRGNMKKDSVHLYEQKLEIFKFRELSSYTEELEQKMSSSFYEDTLIGHSRIGKDYDTILCFYTERFDSKKMDWNLHFYTGLPLGEIIEYNGAMNIKYSEELDSYTVNGSVYTDVKAFENTVVLDSLYVKKIYYARGVGVIRKELFNGQVWNLERYHIAQ